MSLQFQTSWESGAIYQVTESSNRFLNRPDTSSSSLSHNSNDINAKGYKFWKLFRLADRYMGLKDGLQINRGRRDGGSTNFPSQVFGGNIQYENADDLYMFRSDDVYLVPALIRHHDLLSQVPLFARNKMIKRNNNMIIDEKHHLNNNNYNNNNNNNNTRNNIGELELIDWDTIDADVQFMGFNDTSNNRNIHHNNHRRRGRIGDGTNDESVLRQMLDGSWASFVMWNDEIDAKMDESEDNTDYLAQLFLSRVYEEDILHDQEVYPQFRGSGQQSMIAPDSDEELETQRAEKEAADKTVKDMMSDMTETEKKRFLMTQKCERMKALQTENMGLDTAESMARLRANLYRDTNVSSGNITHKLIEDVKHMPVAYQNRNSKSDLSVKELRNFHSPRYSRKSKKKTWMIRARPQTQIPKPDRSRRGRAEDLLLIKDCVVIIEYAEERPAIQLNLGMGSKLVNFYRSKENDEDDVPQSTVASSALAEGGIRSQRVPLMVHQLDQVRAQQEKEQQKEMQTEESKGDAPKTDLGVTEIIHNDREFPLMGYLKPGEMQPAIVNSLFSAPLFRHKAPATDFLLVPIKTEDVSTQRLHFELKPFPSVYLCGQQEPLQKVMKPAKKENEFQFNLVSLRILRLLEKKEEHAILVSNFEIMSKFKTALTLPRPFLQNAVIRRVLKTVAEEKRDKEYQLRDSDDYERADDISKRMSPEVICLYESGNSFDVYLERLGIDNIDMFKLQVWLGKSTDLLSFRQKSLKRAIIALGDMNESHSHYTGMTSIIKAITKDIERLKAKIEVGRYIFEVLSKAPWNTTDAFVGYRDRLDLSPRAPPSGVGSGHVYLRRLKQPQTTTVKKTKAGTSADIRKLLKQEAVEFLVNAGFKRKKAEAIPRWDRTRLIQDIANKAKANGATNPEIIKFCTDEKAGGVVNAKDYEDIIRSIWDDQVEDLTSQKNLIDDSGDREVAMLEEDVDDDDDDSDIDLNEMERQVEASLSRQSSLDSATKRKEDDSDERAAQALRQSFAAASRVNSSTKATSEEESALQNALKEWTRPTKVVKRRRRTLKPDGTEVIEISFELTVEEVEKVQKNRNRNQGSFAEKMSSIIRNEGPYGRSSLVYDSEEDDVEEEPEMIAEQQEKSEIKLNFNVINTKAKRGRDEEKMQAGKYGRGKSSKRNAPQRPLKQTRLPQVHFAARLEKILMDQYEKKSATSFRFPVDAKLYPYYYTKVTHSICLDDMRQKIGRFQYKTLKAFTDDFALIWNNSSIFNGPKHIITKKAKGIHDAVCAEINHEKSVGDLPLLENNVREKYAHWQNLKTEAQAAQAISKGH